MSDAEPAQRARSLRFCPVPYAARALARSRPAGARVLVDDLYEDAHQAGWSWLRCTIRDLADRYEVKKHVVESLLDDLERAGLLEREIATSGKRSVGTRFRLFDPQLLTWSDEEERAVRFDRRTSKPAATAHSGATAGQDRRPTDRVNRPDIDRTSPRTSKPAATAHSGATAGHAAGHPPDTYDRSTDRTIDPPPKPPAAPRPGGSTDEAARARIDWLVERMTAELLDIEGGDEAILAMARRYEQAEDSIARNWFVVVKERRKVPPAKLDWLLRMRAKHRGAPSDIVTKDIVPAMRIAAERVAALLLETASEHPPPGLDPLTPLPDELLDEPVDFELPDGQAASVDG